MKALSQMSQQLRDIHNVLAERLSLNQHLQSENQKLQLENQKQTAASRQALSIAASRIAIQDQKIQDLRKLLDQRDKGQRAAPANGEAIPAPETPNAQKRRRSSDDEQGMRRNAEAEGNAKRRSTWLSRCLNKETDSAATV
jgi:hypothetical protein